jgi:hypothetical protein
MENHPNVALHHIVGPVMRVEFNYVAYMVIQQFGSELPGRTFVDQTSATSVWD